jgi:hypothetical protein
MGEQGRLRHGEDASRTWDQLFGDSEWFESMAQLLPRLTSQLSYFLAASWRNQVKMVAGLTRQRRSPRSSGVSNFPAEARRRRARNQALP